MKKGKWITSSEFCIERPIDVFGRQLEKKDIKEEIRKNRHILYRSDFILETPVKTAEICITADDYYKLYINGKFVCQGPAPSCHTNYCFNRVEVGNYLKKGRNVISVHTLYQGLINRVRQSGDGRCGLIFELYADGELISFSDERVKTHLHTGYTASGTAGYNTQFLETYDCTAAEIGFEQPDFDDSYWDNASICTFDDHILKEQQTKMLCFEKIAPVDMVCAENSIMLDFGAVYVGELYAIVKGKQEDRITVHCGQELNDDGTVRYDMRCNCRYEELWVLRDGENLLEWFDYKSFRYAELIMPEGCELGTAHLRAQHYPFELKASLKTEYAHLKPIWDMCIHTQKYGVQEVIQDCMDREKGFYMGDGCYTALTHMLLTGDDSMARKLIDDGFYSSFITDGLVTCLDCSFMQEIAEYPLMLVSLVLWHYRLTGDRKYLSGNYPKVCALLNVYRREYEKDFLLTDLDKWCVVEWPANFRHGYDASITEGEICKDRHIAINAYYINAVKTANEIARALSLPDYRATDRMKKTFDDVFFDKEKHLFRDRENGSHISLVGNIFPYAFGLCPDKQTVRNITKMLKKEKISSLSMFCTFPALCGLVRYGEKQLLAECLADEGAWRRMLSEGATATFESWGKDEKWNTSLFHMTFSYAAAFLGDFDLEKLLK